MTYKIAILSDIHSDLDALEDALALVKVLRCDEILCAGDLVDYGNAPDGVIELLVQHDIMSVMGNHDRWVVEASRRGMAGYETFGGGTVADKASYEYLDDLPPLRRLTRDGARIVVCHGVLSDDMAELRADEVDAAWCRSLLERADCDVLVVGHTHRPALLEVGAQGLIVNPGALLRSPVSNTWVGAPGTFGVLDVVRRTFEVRDAASGEPAEILHRQLT